MNQETVNIEIGPELSATLERLSGLYSCPKKDLMKIFLEESSFAVEDTFDRSGQIWDSVRFDFVHGGRRAIKHQVREQHIEALLDGLPEVADDN